MAAKRGFTDESMSPAELAELANAIDLDEAMGDAEKPKKRGKELVEQVIWIEPKLPAWAGWLRTSTNLKGEAVRHRVFYGGRGGAKSRSIATELLVRGTRRVERILCAREFQKSIRDSVKRLLDDEINRLGLGVLGNGFYHSTDKEIRGRNGTLFVFHGLHRNEGGIRSLEGITICWVEEARFVTQDSLDALIPTIRQEGSEIWWTYNPQSPDDPVDKMFRGKDGPPPGSIVVEVNYYDNPWFPTTLRRGMEWDQRRDADRHAHIWLGRYLLRSEAKVFKNWKVRPFEIPADAVLRHGADWGFSVDPTVLVQCFIGSWSGEPWESEPVADTEGRVLFVCREAYEVGCEVDEIPALFAGEDEAMHPEQRRWVNTKMRPGVPGSQRWKIIADSARPEIISYLQKRGFNIEPAVKGPGSVEEGVTFLQSFDICVHPDCVHVADELALYSYKVEKKTDEVLPVLADKDNHTIDALRYACEAARRAGTGKVSVASSGKRVTVAALEGGEAAEERKAVERPTPAASAGGKGWGSAAGMREGLM